MLWGCMNVVQGYPLRDRDTLCTYCLLGYVLSNCLDMRLGCPDSCPTIPSHLLVHVNAAPGVPGEGTWGWWGCGRVQMAIGIERG